jgi:SAM-dependent methyltransferase
MAVAESLLAQGRAGRPTSPVGLTVMSDLTPGGAPAWPLVPNFPPDLFKGLAEYHAKYRPAYPPALLDDLVTRAGMSGSGRLFDLACGTGELALALRSHFVEVRAVDLEPDMVEMGRRKAEEIGANNVLWSVGHAEVVDVLEDQSRACRRGVRDGTARTPARVQPERATRGDDQLLLHSRPAASRRLINPARPSQWATAARDPLALPFR